MWRRYRAPLAGAAALAACLAVLAALNGGEVERGAGDGGTGPPPEFLGIVAEDAFGHPGAYRRRSLDRLRAAGVGLVRQSFDWALIERSPGRYDLAFYDRFVAALAERGLRLLPILFNPPPFRSSAPSRGRREGTYPPRRPAALGAFGAILARRYGPDGSFWRDRPGLPRLPVRSWQVWNEPNIPVYWPSGPDSAAYVRLLRATGRAIKRVDPNAQILTAGLPDSELGVPLGTYLEGMYDAGAAGTFDVLALNAFAPDTQGVLATVRAARRVGGLHGNVPAVWITEVGWATGGPPSAFRVSDAEQAELIEAALSELARRRDELGLRGVIYFNWRDSLPFKGGGDFFGLHTGLLRRDGTAKPALDSYRGVAERLGLLPR